MKDNNIGIHFHHVALSVSDLEASEEFYRHFGFTLELEREIPERKLKIARMVCNNACLELFCFYDFWPNDRLNRNLWDDLSQLGVKHFAMKVPDIRRFRDQLLSWYGGDVDEISEGKTGLQYFFLRDPDGILLEIVEVL
jgi:glyoxylase I family protein